MTIEMTAGDVMTTQLVRVAPGDSVLAAWELMSRGDIHHLPVVVGRRCVSLLDDRILAVALANPLDRPRRRVSDVMPVRAHCILADTTVQRAAEIMQAERATALPVVDGEMNLVGIVTDRDIVRVVARGAA